MVIRIPLEGIKALVNRLGNDIDSVYLSDVEYGFLCACLFTCDLETIYLVDIKSLRMVGEWVTSDPVADSITWFSYGAIYIENRKVLLDEFFLVGESEGLSKEYIDFLDEVISVGCLFEGVQDLINSSTYRLTQVEGGKYLKSLEDLKRDLGNKIKVIHKEYPKEFIYGN